LPSLRAPLIGDRPRAVVTTTPKPIKLLIKWQHETDGTIVITTGSLFDNIANLSREVVEEMRKIYEGTRAGLQELYGQLLEDIEGALWKRPMIENNRIKPSELPALKQTVVSIDPGASGSSDETGLIVYAHDYQEQGYVLADFSRKIVGAPAARLAWEVFLTHGATWLVVETNMGKKWLTTVLSDAYKTMQAAGLFPPGPAPIKEVTSLAGKRLRAEPVAARYEQGRIHHVGTFVELEDQQCTWVPGEAESPDRIDALVQAELYLLGGESKLIRIAAPALDSFMPVSSPY
jgi:phage terminase large subunit-like protein